MCVCLYACVFLYVHVCVQVGKSAMSSWLQRPCHIRRQCSMELISIILPYNLPEPFSNIFRGCYMIYLGLSTFIHLNGLYILSFFTLLDHLPEIRKPFLSCLWKSVTSATPSTLCLKGHMAQNAHKWHGSWGTTVDLLWLLCSLLWWCWRFYKCKIVRGQLVKAFALESCNIN